MGLLPVFILPKATCDWSRYRSGQGTVCCGSKGGTETLGGVAMHMCKKALQEQMELLGDEQRARLCLGQLSLHGYFLGWNSAEP